MMMVHILQHKRTSVNGFYLDHIGIRRSGHEYSHDKDRRTALASRESEGFTRSEALAGATPRVRTVLEGMK